MTVAIGLVCKDGVLVAADSMGSDQMTAAPMTKVRALSKAPVIWTSSGTQYVSEEVALELGRLDASTGKDGGPLACFAEPNLTALRNAIKAPLQKAMRAAYDSCLSAPPGAQQHPFFTTFLILGYSNETPWFLEVSGDGQLNWHTEGKFYATGSGGPFATVARGLMDHYIVDDLTLEQGKLIAYRTIQTTIDVSSMFVGGPVRIAVCDSEGPRLLDADEMERIAHAVDGWKAIEAESLTSLSVDATEAPGEEAVEEPPTLEQTE